MYEARERTNLFRELIEIILEIQFIMMLVKTQEFKKIVKNFKIEMSVPTAQFVFIWKA